MNFFRLTAVAVIIASLMIAGCGKSDPRENELRKGAAFIRYLIGIRDMQQAAMDENQRLTPSEISEFIFSDVGAAMWPRTDYFPEGEAPRNTPAYPEEVNLVSGKPLKPWTVTVSGDDSKGEIIIRGYGDKLGKPLFEERFAFRPKV